MEPGSHLHAIWTFTQTADHRTTSDSDVTGVCPMQCAYLWTRAVCRRAEPIGEAFEALPRPSISIPILCLCVLRIREDRHCFRGGARRSPGAFLPHEARCNRTTHKPQCGMPCIPSFRPPATSISALSDGQKEIYPPGLESFNKVWRSPPNPTPQA